MEPIKQNEPLRGRDDKPRNLGEVIEQTTAQKKKILRGVLNNTGIFVGIFIIFVVIVVFTTDIKLTSVFDWTALGLSFFVLLFCAFSMYLNFSDSGIKAGRTSDTYIKSKAAYDELKKEVIDRKMQGRLPEFCRFYIEEELRNTRNSLLTEVGIDFAEYQECYVGKDKVALEKIPSLSKSQIEAILSANNIKPIKLTPEMILKRGRGASQRKPLGMQPEKKRGVDYGIKFVKTCLTSVLLAVIGLDVIVSPSWAMFAACLLKLFPVVLNGFMGYKSGYENIVVDTVNYMNDQADLMRQLIHYVEENPVPKPLVSASEIAEEKALTEVPAAENMPPADGLEAVSAEAI